MCYLCGQLLGLERKTIEPMVLALHGPDLNAIRALQQFISESLWSAPNAVKQHQRLVAEAWRDPLGVAIPQGDRCVLALYATRHGYTFLDARLYTPRLWLAADH